MKILALEFSSSQRSVAAFQAAEAGVAATLAEVIESGGLSNKPFAMIDAALRQAGWEREQIECLAVGLGPGSYTGIRSAIALAQGWQLATGVRLLGLSSAECIAAQAQTEGITGRVTVIVDAQRREFYAGLYDLAATGYRELEPLRLVPEAEVRDCLQPRQQLIGPEVSAWFPGTKLIFPRAANLARLAAKQTGFVPGETLEPIYLRETSFVKAPQPRPTG